MNHPCTNERSFQFMVNPPNKVKIDLSALVFNLNQVKALVSPDTKIMGVVKSDAYGHGLLPVSYALEKNKVDYLGVAHIGEALVLRKGGVKLPIVVLSGIQTRDECREVVKNDITPILFDMGIAEILAQEGLRMGKRTRVHLKVDTGMGRLGLSCDELGLFIRKVLDLGNIDIEGLLSHLSSADEASNDFTDTQIERFESAVQQGRHMGLNLAFNNLANSAGIMGHQRSQFEMVRPGIMLYGGRPSPSFTSPVPLKPVMHFIGRILQIRHLPDRTPVSYGRTYQTNGPRQIGILSAGYGDGLPRGISNQGNVIVTGQKVPIVGTICMNITICDITGLKDVKAGDEVVLLGSQNGQTITGDDMARAVGTISYEIFCSIGHRNQREYLS